MCLFETGLRNDFEQVPSALFDSRQFESWSRVRSSSGGQHELAVPHVLKAIQSRIAASSSTEAMAYEGGTFCEAWSSAWPLGQYTNGTQLSRELGAGVAAKVSRAVWSTGRIFAARIRSLYKRHTMVGLWPGNSQGSYRAHSGQSVE